MKKIIALLLLTLIYQSAYAQADTDNIQRNINTRFNDLLRNREIENRTNFMQDSVTAPQVPQQEAPPAENKKQFNKIEVIRNNVDYISQGDIDKIISVYQGKLMGMSEISSIQEQLQALYINKGYSAARVYIDGNTINSGVLTFVVIEGIIEDITFQTKKGKKYPKLFSSMQGFSFYPFAAGSVLNIKDMDQGLEQMNRLASNNASIEILPGSKDGYCIVAVTNDIGRRFNISLSVDNSGLENSGYYKANAAINSDNLLMLNDNLYFNYSRNIDGYYQDKRNNSYFGSLSIPFGYFTFMASFFNSDYNTVAGTSYGTRYVSDGTTRNKNASLEMIIKRSQKYKFSAGAEMALKETQNFIEHQLIDASSKKLTVASGFLTTTYYIGSSMLYGKLSYNQGLDLFGAVQNYNVPGSPKGQFSSLSLYAQYSQNFRLPLIKLNTRYAFVANGQYSNDILYSSEQISLGGQSSVRGFKAGSVSGNSGAYLRNDLTWTLADIFQNNGPLNILAYTSISGFADIGYAYNGAYKENYTVAGAGAGAAFRTKNINASVYWGRAVYNKSYLSNEGNVIYFSIEGKIYF